MGPDQAAVDTMMLIGTAWALAVDAFSVAVAVSASVPRMSARSVFRLAWHFGVFQALMPVLGWFGGALVAPAIAHIDHWIAFGLLSLLGLHMIRESLRSGNRKRTHDPTRGLSLMGLSLATSIDALIVGVSLGLLGLSIWIPSSIIGLVAFVLTGTGCLIGSRIGRYLGRWAERIAGIVLIGIGTRTLLQHLALRVF